MNYRIIFVTIFLSFLVSGYSQKVSEIKANTEEYIWGEGKGELLDVAEKKALEMLVNSISTYVESSGALNKRSVDSGGDEVIGEDFSSSIKTYSAASLNNTKLMILQNEPDAHVFRYIKRVDVKKVFDQRKTKIIQFVENAEKAASQLKIADAIRYYYWAILLMKSHPYAGEITFMTDDGEKMLASYLPVAINNIFSDIKIKAINVETEDEAKYYTLDIRYKNRPVANFDYSYWDGSSWSSIVGANDGVGTIDLYGVSADMKDIKIKFEYVFKGESRIDRELESVMNNVKAVPFRKAYYKLSLVDVGKNIKPNNIDNGVDGQSDFAENDNSEGQFANQDQSQDGNESGGGVQTKSEDDSADLIEQVKDCERYSAVVKSVLEGIRQKDHLSIKKLFTKDGYDTYTKLLNFGNARLLDDRSLKYYKYKDEVTARSVLMSFDFKANNKKFVEKVNFCFHKSGKIDAISFGLSDGAMNSIISKQVWTESDRMLLVSFLESYKTAYALKRHSFIKSIFADDALIITGREVTVQPAKDSPHKRNKIIRYNRQSKKQYMKNLERMFAMRDYINLKFEDSRIKKSGLEGDVYGINIKQNFYSSNYGDVGYLFLMVDLNDKKKPTIHIRTWQPDANLKDSIYNLADF